MCGALQGSGCCRLAAAQLCTPGRGLQFPRDLFVGCQGGRGTVPGPAVRFTRPAGVGECLVHPLTWAEGCTRVGGGAREWMTKHDLAPRSRDDSRLFCGLQRLRLNAELAPSA